MNFESDQFDLNSSFGIAKKFAKIKKRRHIRNRERKKKQQQTIDLTTSHYRIDSIHFIKTSILCERKRNILRLHSK